ncbi:MAG: hypothetical protein ACK2UR_13830, partial [Candidatus Promineifilaceae bacterium]
MKRSLSALFFAFLAAVLLISGGALAWSGSGGSHGKIVVANRASGSISVIDVETDSIIDNVALPGPNPAEPMYVVYSKFGDRVFVGD